MPKKLKRKPKQQVYPTSGDSCLLSYHVTGHGRTLSLDYTDDRDSLLDCLRATEPTPFESMAMQEEPNTDYKREQMLDFLRGLMTLRPGDRESLLLSLSGKSLAETSKELKVFKSVTARKLARAKERVRQEAPDIFIQIEQELKKRRG